jgi:hypothetical protein
VPKTKTPRIRGVFISAGDDGRIAMSSKSQIVTSEQRIEPVGGPRQMVRRQLCVAFENPVIVTVQNSTQVELCLDNYIYMGIIRHVIEIPS